jgi:hypothetical protein
MQRGWMMIMMTTTTTMGAITVQRKRNENDRSLGVL